MPQIEKSINDHNNRFSLILNQTTQSTNGQADLIQDCDSDENDADSLTNGHHKKQHSISDESFHKQPITRNAPSSSSSNRKAIKKTKVKYLSFLLKLNIRKHNISNN